MRDRIVTDKEVKEALIKHLNWSIKYLRKKRKEIHNNYPDLFN